MVVDEEPLSFLVVLSRSHVDRSYHGAVSNVLVIVFWTLIWWFNM